MPNKKYDPLEQACWDYYHGQKDLQIKIVSNKSDDEYLDIGYFFREWEDMPTIEKTALNWCEGEILDIGAGTGCHTLELKKMGHYVEALEIRKGLAELIRKRGIIKVYCTDIFEFQKKQYDTILMLMNGIGLVKDLKGLDLFLKHAKKLLKPQGQVLFDSSDIMYVYRQEDGSARINLNENYYGEVTYNLLYKNITSEAFKWLFVDYSTLAEIAHANDFRCDLIFEDDSYQYLARIY
jgi:2-polyprenyl-3-methyl-5-hydroxy-6-metoxy-1,4-benzoquinol methylase